jgi:hypothetical protein
MLSIEIPRLNRPAKIEHAKKTEDGEKRSAMVNKAKTNVPVIKPNCTMLVRCAKKPGSRWKLLMRSARIAFPANQREVQKNWAITITGKIHFVVLIMIIFYIPVYLYNLVI